MLMIFSGTERLIKFLIGQVIGLLFVAMISIALVMLTDLSDQSLWIRIPAVGAAAVYLYAVFYFCLCPRSRVSLQSFRIIRDAAFLFAPWIVYVLATDTLSVAGLLQICSFIMVPLILISTIPAANVNRWNWQDLIAIICIWAPFEAGMLGKVWSWPEGGAAYPVNTLMAFCLVYILFVKRRRLPHIGLPFRIPGRSQVLMLFLSLLLFCAVAIPFGLITEFISYTPQVSLMSWGFSGIGIFLFIALPEELLFRGLLMNYFSHRLKKNNSFNSEYLSLILTSVLFGFAHLNNPPMLDWRFVLLSTFAGFLYGFVWMKSKNLLLPALLHMMVNYIWLNVFLGGAAAS